MPSTVACPGCQVRLKLKPEYAGKKIKCPKCLRLILIRSMAGVTGTPPKPAPARAAAKTAARTAAPKAAAAPPIPRTKPKPPPVEEEEAAVVTTPVKKKKGRKSDMSPCPECGEMVDVDAKKCPHCKTLLESDDEEEHKKWKKCPACRKQAARPVLWTIWGSFYFTRLFHQVRCEECGKTYNGKTGGSNLGPAIVCMSVPLMAIAGIGYFIWWIAKDRGHLEYEWVDTVSLILMIAGGVGLLTGIILWLVLRGKSGRR